MSDESTYFHEDMLSVLTHADKLRTRIAEAIDAPEASTARALRALRPSVVNLIGLIEVCVDALTKPEATDRKGASVIDAIAKLQYSTLEFKESWHRNELKDEDLLPALSDLLRLADAIVESAACIAIPWKLCERLERMNAGATLHFDSVVKEWVTNEKIRDRIWKQLLQFRFIVPNGLADHSTGLLFKCSTRLCRRLTSVGALIGLACAGSWVLLNDPFGSLFHYLEFEGWKINPWYCWVLAGVCLQATVKTMGENRSQGFPPFSEIRDWAHVKEVSIAISILASMAAAITLAYSSPDKVNILSGVSTGYALDHLVKAMASRAPTFLGKNPDVVLLKKAIGM